MMNWSGEGSKWRWMVALAVLIAVACSWIPGLESKANEQIDAGLKRALVAFAAARTLNAAVSVIQDTELTIQPVGVGVKLSPGKVLSPVNDLVDAFADVMMMATIAFGVQKALLLIFSDQTVSWVLTALAALWLQLYMTRGAPSILTRMLVILLVARFALPVIAIAGETIHGRLLKPAYDESSQVIQDTMDSVTRLKTEVGPMDVSVNTPAAQSSRSSEESKNTADVASGPKGWIENGIDIFRRAPEVVGNKLSGAFAWPLEKFREISKKIPEVRDRLEASSEHMVRMMALFVVETVILPIGMLWLILALAGRASAYRPLNRPVS